MLSLLTQFGNIICISVDVHVAYLVDFIFYHYYNSLTPLISKDQ